MNDIVVVPPVSNDGYVHVPEGFGTVWVGGRGSGEGRFSTANITQPLGFEYVSRGSTATTTGVPSPSVTSVTELHQSPAVKGAVAGWLTELGRAYRSVSVPISEQAETIVGNIRSGQYDRLAAQAIEAAILIYLTKTVGKSVRDVSRGVGGLID